MSTNLPPMVQTAADAGREVLQNAGVDLEQLEQRRELAAAMLPPVLAAARGVIDNLGKPGAAARFGTLADAVENLTQNDPISAVVVAAAIWADRYGSAGAPERLTDLQDAVDGLHRPRRVPQEAITDAEYITGPEKLSDLFTDDPDGPPCDVDPVAHEERLAYLEPDDGQD